MFGFLSKVFSPSTKQQHKAGNRNQIYSGEFKGEILIDGDRRTQFYCYNPSPFKGIRKGQTVTLDVVNKEMRLKSLTSGFVYDTRDDGGVALSYNGEVVGTPGRGEKAYRQMLLNGYKVSVTATKVGNYTKSIPEFELNDVDNLGLWLWYFKKYPKHVADNIADFVEPILFNSNSDDVRGELPDIGNYHTLAKIDLKPISNSKRKPLVSVALTSELSIELPAKREAYKLIEPYAGNEIECIFEVMKSSISDGNYCRVRLFI